MKNINRDRKTIGGGRRFPLRAFMLAAAAAAMAAAPQWVFADVADRINFQGRLIDPATKNPQDGSFDITFRVCDSLAGACTGGTKLWEELQTVPVDNGVFEVVLGKNVAISSSVFSGGARYLEIQVENETLGPRQRMVAVPTALRAAVAESLEGVEIIELRDTLQTGATFYVSSGTVATDFQVLGNARVIGNLRLDGVLTAGSGAVALTSAAGLIDASKIDPGTLVPNASLDPSSVTKLSASGLVPDYLLDASSVTLQGNAFNAADRLLRLDSAGLVPNSLIDGSSVTKLDASGLVPNGLIDASSVTKQGNTFNVADRLVRLDGAGAYPALDGSGITGIVHNDPTKLPLAGGTMTGAIDFGTGSSLNTATLPEITVSTHINVTGHVAASGYVSCGDCVAQVYDAAGGLTMGAAYVSIPFNTQTVVDALYSHSTTVNPSRVTVNKTGLYRITYSLGFVQPAKNKRMFEAQVAVNGTGAVPGHSAQVTAGNNNDEYSLSATFLASLNAGDFVEVQARFPAGGNTIDTVANQSWLAIEFIR